MADAMSRALKFVPSLVCGSGRCSGGGRNKYLDATYSGIEGALKYSSI